MNINAGLQRFPFVESEELEDDLYFAFSSFELERSLEASRRLADAGGYSCRCGAVVHLKSRTSAGGVERQEQSRSKLFEYVSVLDQANAPRLFVVGAYEPLSLIRLMIRELGQREIGHHGLRLTIDISCMTRIQLAVTLLFVIMEWRPRRLRLLYTEPVEYVTTASARAALGNPRFKTMPFPLREFEHASGYEAIRLAVVLLGHEGQRTMAAWRHADPDATMLVFPTSEDPKLSAVTSKQNDFLLEYAFLLDAPVELIHCEYRGMNTVKDRLLEFREEMDRGVPVKLHIVPFGPKPLVVGALLGALGARDVAVDLVYSIPFSYSSEYSEGVRRTSCFNLVDADWRA